jgi:hypothetical protein
MDQEPKTKKYEFIESVDFEGFECNEGWDRLILTALDIVEAHLDSKHRNDPNAGHIILDQVKEKFGTLRIYYTDYSKSPEYISGVFDFAEMMSHHICEKCGKPGSTRHNLSWMQTLCENHYIGVMAKKLDYTKLLDSEK